MNAVVGGLAQNVETILGRFRAQGATVGADLVLSPELALTGYPPEDLLLKEGFVEAPREALSELARARGLPPILVGTVVAEGAGVALAPAGRRPRRRRLPVRREPPSHLANAAGGPGRRRGRRHGDQAPAAQLRRLRRAALLPAGRRARRRSSTCAGVAVGLRDLRGRVDRRRPGGRAGRARARRCSWSPTRRPTRAGAARSARRCCATRALETGCPIAYVNLVGGQDELVFDGQSCVVDAHGRRHRARRGVPRGAARRRRRGRASRRRGRRSTTLPARRAAGSRARPVNHVAEPLDEVEEVYEALVLGHARLPAQERIPLGGARAVGRDRLLARGDDRRRRRGRARGARRWPCRAATPRADSVDDAVELAAPPRHRGDDAADRGGPRGARGDRSSRRSAASPPGSPTRTSSRGSAASCSMAVSNATGAIVLTTGNKSEMATGYSTLYGDSAGRVRGDQGRAQDAGLRAVPLPQRARRSPTATPPIPASVLDKPPSAELRPDQRDDQSLPPYEVLDPLLELYVEERRAPPRSSIAAGYDPALVRARGRARRPQRVQAPPDAARRAHLEEGLRPRPAHAHHQRLPPRVNVSDRARARPPRGRATPRSTPTLGDGRAAASATTRAVVRAYEAVARLRDARPGTRDVPRPLHVAPARRRWRRRLARRACRATPRARLAALRALAVVVGPRLLVQPSRRRAVVEDVRRAHARVARRTWSCARDRRRRASAAGASGDRRLAPTAGPRGARREALDAAGIADSLGT